MKKYLLSALALAMATATFAQANRTCGTEQHEAYLQQKDPNRAAKRAAYEKAIQKYLATNPQANQKNQAVVTIPLVVHLVWRTATENIQDAQIQSQIDVLNADYTGTNADAANIPAAFQGVASSPQIQFCWASVDPSGNPTNGIERRQTTVTSFTTDDKVKYTAQGGLDSWDPSKYFNIWVCNMGGGLLGYGEFPTGSPTPTWGFVAGYTCFGDTLQVNAPYNKGRTATHEIGHCLNLYHIWGDDGSACTGSDQCADTPNQAGENYGCPTFPKTDACQTASPGVMFMNYMDYTDDACMYMFTANQSSRMTAVINSAGFTSLTTSTVCVSGPLPNNDAGITTIIQPTGTGCSTSIIPQVVIRNYGGNAITSATINYKVDNGSVMTQAYSGNLASLASATVTLPATAVTAGTHTFSAYTTLPNGVTDATPANDAATPTTFQVITTGSTLPLVEGFENATFPPTGWTLNNPDGSSTWERTTAAKKSGVASAYVDNYNYNASGQVDELVTPALNIQGSSPQMTFQVAYRLYTDPGTSPNYSDTLNVMISTNCGTTWTSLYKKFSSALTTITPVFSTTAFTPTTAQWRLETISLTSYSNTPMAFIKFKHSTDYENNMYIDDINIVDNVGIASYASNSGISVYPNPSADGKFVVDIKQGAEKVQRLSVYDMLGNKVFSIDQNIPSGMYDMNLDNLTNGTYMVEVLKDSKPVYTRIVINK